MNPDEVLLNVLKAKDKKADPLLPDIDNILIKLKASYAEFPEVVTVDQAAKQAIKSEIICMLEGLKKEKHLFHVEAIDNANSFMPEDSVEAIPINKLNELIGRLKNE